MNIEEKLKILEDERDKLLIALFELDDITYSLARLARNTDGLFPSTWGQQVSRCLLRLRAFNQIRYDQEVM